MRILLLLLVLAAPTLAVNGMWIPDPGMGWCDINGVSTATPIIVSTVQTTASCNITATGNPDYVIHMIQGATIANSHLHATTADEEYLHFKVTSVTTNGFTLLTASGANTVGTVHGSCSGAASTHAGNCAYVRGGRVMRAIFVPAKAPPNGLLDGVGGVVTGKIAARAVVGNPAYNAIMTASAAYYNNYASRFGYEWSANSQNPGSLTMAAALDCYLNGTANACTAAKFSMTNKHQLWPSTACDQAFQDCGQTAPGGGNETAYVILRQINYALALPLMDAAGEMSGPEITAFWKWYANDLPWWKAGLQPADAPAFNVPAFYCQPATCDGTVSVSPGSTTVTGAGTSFVSGDAGKIIQFNNSFGKPYKIASVNVGAQTLTLATPNSSGNTITNETYFLGPEWTDTDMGIFWWMNNTTYAPLGGGGGEQIAPNLGATSPYLGQLNGFYASIDHNHAWNRGAFPAVIGMTGCYYEMPMCLLGMRGIEWMFNRVFPVALNTFTGFSFSNPIYHSTFTTPRPVLAFEVLKNSFTGAPDYFDGTDFQTNYIDWFAYAAIPKINKFPPHGSDHDEDVKADSLPGLGWSAMSQSASTAAKNFVKFVSTNLWSGGTQALTASLLGAGTHQNAADVFLSWPYEDLGTATYGPTTRIWKDTINQTKCLDLFGSTHCSQTKYADVKRMAISRGPWDALDRGHVVFYVDGYAPRDHYSAHHGGILNIWLNGRRTYLSDSAAGLGTPELALTREYYKRRNDIQIGSESNFQFYSTGGAADNEWGTPMTGQGDDTYMAVSADLVENYLANVSVARRKIVHFKPIGGTEYVILADSGVVNNQAVTQWHHFHLNGVGTPSSPGSTIAFDSSAATLRLNLATGNLIRMNAKFAKLDGCVLAGSGGSDGNGSYSGSAGHTFRAECVKAASNSYSFVAVLQFGANNTLVMPQIDTHTSSNHSIYEALDLDGYPAVGGFADGTATSSALSYTTTHAGTAQHVLNDIVAGTYDVTRNGSLVCSNCVVDSNGVLKFDAAAGAIVVALDGGAPAATGGSRPTGKVRGTSGVRYN